MVSHENVRTCPETKQKHISFLICTVMFFVLFSFIDVEICLIIRCFTSAATCSAFRKIGKAKKVLLFLD